MLALTSLDMGMLFGLSLTSFASLTMLRHARRIANPEPWVEKAKAQTFLAAAWEELGRALMLGVPAAAGLLPFALYIFLDTPHAFQNIVFFDLMLWAAFAIVFYFTGMIGGFIGYARHVGKNPKRRVNLATQFGIVGALSAPLAYVFVAYLALPIGTVTKIAAQSAYAFLALSG